MPDIFQAYYLTNFLNRSSLYQNISAKHDITCEQMYSILATTLLLLENGNIIGTSACCASRYASMENYGEIVSLYFLPEYMGKGYGKLLLRASIDALVKKGYHDIFLWVLADNKRARKFYETFGFKANGAYLSENIGGKDLKELQYLYHVD